ncbi:MULTISPECIES: TetR/AcrR family transcriptional regulator [unclassified Frondihabitans]|uniref:TetR/AcrR family transcriptional regulator n=1 Tax=unclassified Frondihabitans TaxID=2626248 RepID=UPI000F93AFA5|nr:MULTISPECIES: TetR family transcriptional regulator [unclassified Frondihabitans]RPE78103.1 TetR family transcriptional regulator [Frondihabitans sp. PhB153]RPF08384.1 TetR family transcriptional regulator [Frondihabitans sp. PhB161]
MTPAPTLTAATPLTDIQRAAVAAADDLFTLNGITPVSLEAIAGKAGITTDLLHAVYPTKQALVVAVLAWKHQGWVDRLQLIGDTTNDPRDEILNIFSYLEESFSDKTWRGCAFINANGELGRNDPVVARLVEQHFTEVERHISVLVARAGMPTPIAEALTLLIQGARAESGVHHTVQPARAARAAAAMLMAVYHQREAAPDSF